MAICRVGSVPKKWLVELGYGADLSVDALDGFFSGAEVGLSVVLFVSVFGEVVLLGLDLLA
jgi:hypothetical protein